MSNIDRFNDYFSNKPNQSKSLNLNENNAIKSNIPSSYDYEWVDINTMWEYREFDRSKESENRGDSNDVIEDLSHKLQDGFTSPLIIQYSHKYKTAYLIEGNHRLLVARRMGYKYVPIRVTIDGYESKTAKKVVGYYASINDRVSPSLPSEIGISNCFDKNFKPVKSEEDSFKEDITIDFDKLPDATIKGNSIEVLFENENETDFMFDSEDFQYIEDVLNNVNVIYKYHKMVIMEFMDINNHQYFTDEMKKFIDVSVIKDEDIDEENYPDIYSQFYHEHFDESVDFYNDYMEEISNIIWKKIREKELDIISYSSFESPYAGDVEWLNGKITRRNDFVKTDDNGGIKKVELDTYSLSYDGLVLKDEEIDEYELSGNETTFKEILEYNYNRDGKILIDFEIDNLEKYYNTISIQDLDIEKIFKK